MKFTRKFLPLVMLILATTIASAADTGTKILKWKDGKKAAFMIGFDDSAPSQLQNVVPELEKRKIIGNFYLVTGNGLYAALKRRWEDAAKSPYVIVSNHTFTHKGVNNAEELEPELAKGNEVIYALHPERKQPRLLGFGKPGFPVTWGCNAKANVPMKVLKAMKEGGCRVLLVGYESGNQQILHNIKKGLLTKVARQFTKDCHELGIVIHGTFILGLPGETEETIEETIRYAKEIDPHTIQVSLAAPYPGTFLYKQATENGWFDNTNALLTEGGTQIAQLSYPHLSSERIFDKVEEFYKRFYFRPSKIGSIVWEMLRDWNMMKRRLREGVEFFEFLRHRKEAA